MTEVKTTANCRACKAVIFWAATASSRRQPMNVEPDPEGPFAIEHVLATGEPVVVRAALVTRPDAERYTSHFATCPNSTKRRKGAR